MIDIEARCEFMDLKPWTVGARQNMVCRWERDTEFQAPFRIQFTDEINTYTLVLLEAKASARELQAVVTGYKPGDYQNIPFKIISGDMQLSVAPLSWKIESLLKQEQAQPQGEQQQPAPSFGPFMLPFPPWILWSALVLFIAVIGTAVFAFYKRRQKKLFQKELAAYLHQGSPHVQIHTALRTLIRLMDTEQKSQAEALKEMDVLLRQYLMGTFSAPTKDISAEKLLGRLASRSEKWSKDLQIQFRQFIFDLERLHQQTETLTQDDLLDLCFRLRRLIDLVQFQRGRK